MTGQSNKSLKNLVYAGIVGLAMLGGRKVKADSHEHYFPLTVGNSWTYTNGTEEKTFSIIGKEEINGCTYYKFDDYWGELREGEQYLFRYDRATDKVLMWDSWWYDRHGEEVVRYDFTGGGWDGGLLGWCRLKRGGVDCNVPAGEFSDSINFQFHGTWCGPDAYGFGEYLAPNVGNVKYVVPGGEFPGMGHEGEVITFELQSYTICGDPNHPYPIGDLNYDCRVNLLDFAILAAYWLECTGPECD